MSKQEQVEVPFDDPSKQATLLLAAAEELDQDPDVVRTYEGGFLVPKDVADKAGFGEKPDEDESDDNEPEPEKPKATKKAAAKKTAAKKSESEEG